jgi:glycerophosphoryl diester phosphodiesterase
MAAEKVKFFEEKVNTIKISYSFSENAKDNFKNNLNLFKLNEQHVQDIFGEQSTELSEEEKMHLFDKKINNCEIEEKINLNITMKNPNKEYKYETEIYDEKDNLIEKTEKQGGKDEITLSDNSELVYKFTKNQSIKIVLTKYTSSNDKIRTVKTIPLKKIISKNKNKKLEEKIEDFKDNELINIDYGLSEETKVQKVIELNFEALNKDKNENLSYSIQKDDKVLFKSAICNSTNIRGFGILT